MSPKRTLLVLLASASLAVTALPAAASAHDHPHDVSAQRDHVHQRDDVRSPGDFNPLNTGDYTTGTLGLLYEPLFLYNPLTNKFIPWLAQSGSWTGAKQYTLTLRQGLKWNDGTALTADDVVYTVDLGKLSSCPYIPLWNFLSSVTKVNSTTVQFTFSKPEYQEWSNWLYNYAILPSAHLGDADGDDPAHVQRVHQHPQRGRGRKRPLRAPDLRYDRRSSGSGTTPGGAQSVLGLTMKPKYIVDEVNGSNNVELGQMLAGSLDLSNNFLPASARSSPTRLAATASTTYYPKPPYMLSANTAWLATNDVKKPMNDPVFRRALAMSINVTQIVNNVYGQIVQPPTRPVCCPSWSQYVDQSLVKQYGFTYNPAAARALLTEAGYKMGSDGYFRNKDGSPINLQLEVPNGWTDWMAAIQSIAQSAKAGGIKITPVYPSYNDFVKQAADTAPSIWPSTTTPRSAIRPGRTTTGCSTSRSRRRRANGNYGRTTNKQIWALTQQLDTTPSTTSAR